MSIRTARERKDKADTHKWLRTTIDGPLKEARAKAESAIKTALGTT